MIIDKHNIFPKIAKRLSEEFPKATFWIKGSRLGLRKGNKYDFDVIVNIDYLTRLDYIQSISSFHDRTIPIIKEFKSINDEFGNPVKLDISFTQDADKIEKWRQIII